MAEKAIERDAWTRFTAAMHKIMSVSKEELNRREAVYKEQTALNPHKRGPKPKRKPAGHGPVAAPPA
jgi:hypothetical protein